MGKITDKYLTPKWLMELFEEWFDPCPRDYNEETHTNGLEIEWSDKTYVNPPYSNPFPWVKKAIEERKKGKRIVMLLKVDTSTKWFAKIIEAKAHIFWLKGRMTYYRDDFTYDGKVPYAFPSMLIVF